MEPRTIPKDSKRHITVFNEGDGSPKSQYCERSTLYKCPFCPHQGPQYTLDNYHVKNHASVKFREFTIIKCGLNCRDATHFHCCYCTTTFRHRADFLKHLQQHDRESRALEQITVLQAPGQPTEAPRQQPDVLALASKHPDVKTPPGQPTEVPGQQLPTTSASASNNLACSPAVPLVGQSNSRSLHEQFSCVSSLEQFLVQQGTHNHLGLGQGASDSNSTLVPPPALQSSHSHSHSTPQHQQNPPGQATEVLRGHTQERPDIKTPPGQPIGFLHPQTQPGASLNPSLNPQTQPGASLHPQTQPGVSLNPSLNPQTQPWASLHPQTQPGVSLLPQTQPWASLHPQTQPGASLHPQTQPGVSLNPSLNPQTQPWASLHPQTQPGVSLHPQTQPGVSLLPQTQPGVSLHPQTQPGASLNPQTQPGVSLNPKTQPTGVLRGDTQERPDVKTPPGQPTGVLGQFPPTHPDAQSLGQPRVGLNNKRMVTCPECGLELNKKNLKTHWKRKHNPQFQTVSKDRFLASECIDMRNGVFAVEQSFSGPATPIHVIKNTWGSPQKIICEVEQCQLLYDFALRSGMLSFECDHISSLLYGPLSNNNTVNLTEEALVTMVENKWFGEERKDSLLQRQKDAEAEGVPLSVKLSVGGPSKLYISVCEAKVSHYCRLGRLIVAYDSKQNSWHCPCNKTKHSCPHKAIAKWHLFVTDRQLFRRVKNTEETEESLLTEPTTEEDYPPRYPPSDKVVEKMLKYLLVNKKLPAELPMEITMGKLPQDAFPKRLIPKEINCHMCGGILSEPVRITASGRILTIRGLVEGISTYRKHCLICDMVYRYQEWEDGVHNFDDHIIMSIELCIKMRMALQTHQAVSRVVEGIEGQYRVSFPNKERVLHAYLHFEALTGHEYMFACVTCGYSPSVVVMDLHKKGVFNMAVSEIPCPPDDYDGHVDIEKFWDAVSSEMISHGLIPCGRKNPFVVPPSYHYWAPWIGPQTRRSNVVLNTEFKKKQEPTVSNDSDDQQMTEERLVDELMDLKVEALKELCKACGVHGKGSKSSKMDLVLKLREKMSNRVTYNKVFQKVWGASGGWAVVNCPHGIVCSVKYVLRAEGPRDYVDILLSWKHYPNIAVYDYPRGLVTEWQRFTNHSKEDY